jgi:TetR/AcrR family transcriptional repressor of multidrug resistance operon
MSCLRLRLKTNLNSVKIESMKPKDEKKIAAIASATYDLVAEYGLSALTLADIAKRVGIATSTLYVYYSSKESLLDAVYERAKTATFHRILVDDDRALPFKARIRRIWGNMLNNRLQNHAEIGFEEQYYHSAYLSDANRQLGAKFLAAVMEIMVSGQQSEQIKDVPLPLIVSFTGGTIKELANAIRSKGLPDDETIRTQAFLLYWDAIKA